LALAWATGLYSRSSRTARFVAIASATTGAWAIASLAGAPLVVRHATLLILVLTVFVPKLFGAAAETETERSADAVVENFEPAAVTTASRRLEFLEQLRAIVPDDAARITAFRLRLWAAARRFDASVLASTTPAEHFDRSGMRFLRDAQWRRVLGRSRRVTLWDEDTALRGFHEDAQDLIPREVFGQEPPVEVGPWATAIETLLVDLELAPLRVPVAQEGRNRLIEAIRATVATALGDRSEQSKQRQARAAADMIAAWQTMADELAEEARSREIARR
jgi:hypothetical protein